MVEPNHQFLKSAPSMSLQSRGFPVFSRVSRAAMTLTFLVAGAVAAQADSWRATYSVSLLGLPIGTSGMVGETAGRVTVSKARRN